MSGPIDITTAVLLQEVQSSKKALSLDDTLKVWKSVGNYVKDQLMKGSGVKLDNLGTFTLTKAGTLTFVLALEFTNNTNTKQGGVAPLASNPVNKISWAGLASNTGVSREKLRQSVEAVVVRVTQLVKQRKSVRLSFAPVGEISFDAQGRMNPNFFQEAKELVRDKALEKLESRVSKSLASPEKTLERVRTASSVRNATDKVSNNRRRRPSTSNSSSSFRQTPVASVLGVGVVAGPIGTQSLGAQGVIYGRKSEMDPKQPSLAGIFANDRAEPETVILDRIKEKLKMRNGLNGIHCISRMLKILDNNGDKRISKEELNYGLRDFGVDISGSDLDILMHLFDRDKNGYISFDELLRGLRGELNERRTQLVRIAFQTADVTGDGRITLEDIRECYDPSKHPEVVAGVKTKDQVMNEFLSLWFRPGEFGESDGIVTWEEFLEYYKNLSASIDGDDYFELMIRNAWHISGGKGSYANSSNQRILITHNDGRQTVEEVVNDITFGRRKGGKEEERQGIIDHMRTNGHASMKSFDRSGYIDNTTAARPRDSTMPARHVWSEKRQIAVSSVPKFYGDVNVEEDSDTKYRLTNRYRQRQPTPALYSQTNRPQARGSTYPASSLQEQSHFASVETLKQDHWAATDYGDESLPPPAAAAGEDYRRPSSQGERRRPVSRELFQSAKTMEPDIIFILKKYLFDPPPDGSFSLAPTMSSGPPPGQSNSSFVPPASQTSTPIFRGATLEEMTNRLGVNRVLADGAETMNVNAFIHQLYELALKMSRVDPTYHLTKKQASEVGHALTTDDTGAIDIVDLHRQFQSRYGMTKDAMDAQSMLEKLKNRVVQAAGHTGINNIKRVLSNMDENGDRKISREELKSGLAKLNVLLNFTDLDHLFTFFDRDRSGTIDFEELLSGLRGQMNERRLDLVLKAFALLDRTGDGVVDVSDIRECYDVSNHPDVKKGTKTPEEAMREFLSNFESADKDGIVTKEEFIDYYRNLSASVDGDDYFELMIRNAWHISGGSGWCANTSNRRVLVTDADGRQRVEEIKDDIRMYKAKDNDIRQHLQQRGVRAGKIDAYGYVDNQAKATAVRPAHLLNRPRR